MLIKIMQVVPSQSSSLDDLREHAESLPANHIDMCKISGEDDPKYKQVGGELKKIMAKLVEERNAAVAAQPAAQAKGGHPQQLASDASKFDDVYM